jgi:hypothetical protein
MHALLAMIHCLSEFFGAQPFTARTDERDRLQRVSLRDNAAVKSPMAVKR